MHAALVIKYFYFAQVRERYTVNVNIIRLRSDWLI